MQRCTAVQSPFSWKGEFEVLGPRRLAQGARDRPGEGSRGGDARGEIGKDARGGKQRGSEPETRGRLGRRLAGGLGRAIRLGLAAERPAGGDYYRYPAEGIGPRPRA